MATRPSFIAHRLCICGAVLALSTGTGAATPPKAAKRTFGVQPIPKLPTNTLERLQSGDAALIQSALDDVRVAGQAGAVAVPVIATLLRQGVSLALTRAAIETLGETESEAASDVLSWYARHRDVEVRKSAVQALAHAGGPETVLALRVALTDSEPSVRGLAATGLGTLKVHEAVADLFTALDHGVKDAATSVGQICAPSDCEKLVDKLGRMPLDVVTSGIERVLFRPAAEVSDDLKLKIVGRVRELGTAGAHGFLRGVQARWPKGGSPQVRQAIDEAVRATSASPGREPRRGLK
jgi:hypothetical protein